MYHAVFQFRPVYETPLALHPGGAIGVSSYDQVPELRSSAML